MENEQILTTLEQWESKGEMTLEMAELIDPQLDAFIEGELSEVQAAMDKQELNYAFARLSHMASFLNAAIARRPAIFKKLKKWVQRLKAVVQSLAKKLGANGFSISVGLPVGISISLSFPVT